MFRFPIADLFVLHLAYYINTKFQTEIMHTQIAYLIVVGIVY